MALILAGCGLTSLLYGKYKTAKLVRQKEFILSKRIDNKNGYYQVNFIKENDRFFCNGIVWVRHTIKGVFRDYTYNLRSKKIIISDYRDLDEFRLNDIPIGLPIIKNIDVSIYWDHRGVGQTYILSSGDKLIRLEGKYYWLCHWDAKPDLHIDLFFQKRINVANAYSFTGLMIIIIAVLILTCDYQHKKDINRSDF